MKMRRFAVDDGISVAADVGGDTSGATVILLHGGGQTRHSWHGAMKELLAQGYGVVNLDGRGHGESDWSPHGDYSLQALAADLRAVIEQLHTKPVLVGASMGGATALYAVGTAPEPIASALILVDIVPKTEPVGVQRILAFMQAYPDGFADIDAAADAVSEYYPHRPRPKDYSGLMRNLRRRDNGRLYWHWDPQVVSGPQTVEPPRAEQLLNEAARNVHIPTLVIRGLHSDIVSESGIEELRRCIPHLEVYDVAGAGHMVAGDRNDAFNLGVISFLRRHVPL